MVSKLILLPDAHSKIYEVSCSLVTNKRERLHSCLPDDIFFLFFAALFFSGTKTTSVRMIDFRPDLTTEPSCNGSGKHPGIRPCGNTKISPHEGTTLTVLVHSFCTFDSRFLGVFPLRDRATGASSSN